MEAVRLDSQNLRDILRAKQDDAPLERFESNRTLLDIIRDEPGNGTAFKDGRRNWRHLKDKLRLRRNGSGSNWTSSVRIPASDIPLINNTTGRRSFTDSNSSRAMDRASGRFEHTSSLAMRRLQRERNEDNENEENEEDDDEEEGDGGGEPVRTSLMALLAEETERQMGLDGLLEDDDDDDDEDEEEDISGGGEGYNNCCVCMVRHKGAAFIPCGHTFCRLCSRELYAQRGNCPLCNNYILEILDIF